MTNIVAPVDSLSRPFISVLGSTLRVVQYRYGFSANPFAKVLEWTSSDRGATFDGGRTIGSIPFDEGVFGPGDTVSGATNASSQGMVFQNMPLGGGSAGSASAVLSSDHPYNGTVGLVDATTPLTVFDNGSSFAQFRRYDGSGSLNDAANWTPAADIGYADYPRLAGGPLGLFMISGLEQNQIAVRRYDGTTFTAPVQILEQGEDVGAHLAQDAVGRLHAVIPKGQADGFHLVHATSDDGVSWRKGSVLVQSDGGIAEARAAVAPDHIGVAVWWTGVLAGPRTGAKEIRVAAIGPDAPAKPAAGLPRRSQPPATARRLKNGNVLAAVKGKLRLPATISSAQGCNGKVVVRFKRGKRAIASKSLKVGSQCAFRGKAVLAKSKVKGARQLAMKADLQGQPRARPRQADLQARRQDELARAVRVFLRRAQYQRMRGIGAGRRTGAP